MTVDVVTPLYEDPQQRPPVFWTPVWRVALSCFPFSKAMTVDLCFGARETDWLMEERMPGVPSSHTWLTATFEHSLGLMVRLQSFGVPCPHTDDIVQYAVNHNQFDTLVLFTSTEFAFRGLDGHPLRDSKFVPRIDKAVLRSYSRVVQYCVWRYGKQKERLLKRPLETLAYLMDHNHLRMLKTVVPRLLRVSNLTGLRAACQKGFTKLMQYVLLHLDAAVFTSETLPEELLILAAKHGHLSLLQLLQTYKGDGHVVPRKAYQQAFSWGRMNVCEYLTQHYSDYRPDKADVLDACLHGHVAAIESLPPHWVLPDECMERAVKSRNPKMIYQLHARMPGFTFNLPLLHEAIHSKNSDVCLAVFDCGGYTRLPVNHDVELARNRMRKALKMFHMLGFKVYTERAFVESCRICCIDIIRDILELPPEERLVIAETAWTTALCAIQVSPEIRRDKRIEAHDYVNDKFKLFQTQRTETPPPQPPQPPLTATTMSTTTETAVSSRVVVAAAAAKSAAPSSKHQRPLSDKARQTKRLKHVKSQAHK